MKTFIILIVSFVVCGQLGGASAAPTDTVFPPLDKIEKVEQELAQISINLDNPSSDTAAHIDINLSNFSHLLEIFTRFKQYDIDFSENILKKITNEDTLSGAELFVLRRTITTYYKINKKILDFAKLYDESEFKTLSTFVADKTNIPIIKAHLIWLAGHLLVLDHLEMMHTILYESNGKFRRIVKNALRDKTTDDENEDEVTKTLNDLIKLDKYTIKIGSSEKFSQQINLFRAIQLDLKNILIEEPLATSLVNTIVSNETAEKIAQGKLNFEVENYNFIDSALSMIDNVTGWLSSVFGNFAGSIKWRRGYFYKNKLALNIASNNLIPLDILLEKSPFILTDKFIPGHYGHAAIYLGTKDQLQYIDMWDHPSIVPYHQDIQEGRVILEAVRSGVRLNYLSEFLNIDELTIIRKVDGLKNTDVLVEEIYRGIDQIGKSYDFNFDISTLDKIVCSELIYITYGNVRWPTQYRFGRATITPDNIAEILFQKNTKFQIQNAMVAKGDEAIRLVDTNYVAHELDYEKRAQDGTPMTDTTDETNSYWKKETNCYSIKVFDNDAVFIDNDDDKYTLKRFCKTTYKEFFYEERESL